MVCVCVCLDAFNIMYGAHHGKLPMIWINVVSPNVHYPYTIFLWMPFQNRKTKTERERKESEKKNRSNPIALVIIYCLHLSKLWNKLWNLYSNQAKPKRIDGIRALTSMSVFQPLILTQIIWTLHFWSLKWFLKKEAYFRLEKW